MVETRTTAPPKLDPAGMAQMQAKMKALAPKFKTELLDHASATTLQAEGERSWLIF